MKRCYITLCIHIVFVSFQLAAMKDDIVTKLSDEAIAGRSDRILHAIQHGIDPNAHDIDGNSLLHKATLNGNYNTVRVLIENGANPNITNDYGETPLHWLHHGKGTDQELVFIQLLQSDANPYHKDIQNKTPYDAGKDKNNISLLCSLYDHYKLNDQHT